MKNILIAIISALLLSSCGVGSYSIASGKSDECSISFTSAEETQITVSVDDSNYTIYTVEEKAWKTDRKIKETTQNTIKLNPGAHVVKVIINETEVFSKKLFISTSEHKVIEL